jgi:hypothetical protein
VRVHGSGFAAALPNPLRRIGGSRMIDRRTVFDDVPDNSLITDPMHPSSLNKYDILAEN